MVEVSAIVKQESESVLPVVAPKKMNKDKCKNKTFNSCLPCRKLHQRCIVSKEGGPCDRCIKRKCGHMCVFEAQKRRGPTKGWQERRREREAAKKLAVALENSNKQRVDSVLPVLPTAVASSSSSSSPSPSTSSSSSTMSTVPVPPRSLSRSCSEESLLPMLPAGAFTIPVDVTPSTLSGRVRAASATGLNLMHMNVLPVDMDMIHGMDIQPERGGGGGRFRSSSVDSTTSTIPDQLTADLETLLQPNLLDFLNTTVPAPYTSITPKSEPSETVPCVSMNMEPIMPMFLSHKIKQDPGSMDVVHNGPLVHKPNTGGLIDSWLNFSELAC
jgi:hypothetical protein